MSDARHRVPGRLDPTPWKPEGHGERHNRTRRGTLSTGQQVCGARTGAHLDAAPVWHERGEPSWASKTQSLKALTMGSPRRRWGGDVRPVLAHSIPRRWELSPAQPLVELVCTPRHVSGRWSRPRIESQQLARQLQRRRGESRARLAEQIDGVFIHVGRRGRACHHRRGVPWPMGPIGPFLRARRPARHQRD